MIRLIAGYKAAAYLHSVFEDSIYQIYIIYPNAICSRLTSLRSSLSFFSMQSFCFHISVHEAR